MDEWRSNQRTRDLQWEADTFDRCEEAPSCTSSFFDGARWPSPQRSHRWRSRLYANRLPLCLAMCTASICLYMWTLLAPGAYPAMAPLESRSTSILTHVTQMAYRRNLTCVHAMEMDIMAPVAIIAQTVYYEFEVAVSSEGRLSQVRYESTMCRGKIERGYFSDVVYVMSMGKSVRLEGPDAFCAQRMERIGAGKDVAC